MATVAASASDAPSSSSILSTVEPFYTVQQASRLAQVCDATIRRALRTGALKGRQFGHVWRIRRDWLVFFLENPQPHVLSAEALEARRARNRRNIAARWRKAKAPLTNTPA
jgi:excisionase family DNA binding protein